MSDSIEIGAGGGYPAHLDQQADAPTGYEWVLMPKRPFQRSPGETGHYSDLNPEPIQIEEMWNLDFFEGSALKYLVRYKKKGGVEDLEKVIFYCGRMIDRENRRANG